MRKGDPSVQRGTSRFFTDSLLMRGLEYFDKRCTNRAGRIGNAEDRGERRGDVHGGNFTKIRLAIMPERAKMTGTNVSYRQGEP
jgi:hypothetical protein